MARYTYVVMTNAVEGQDDELNTWYDNQHIHDVLKVAGFKSAQRLKLAHAVTKPPVKHQYLALYEIETDDLNKTLAAFDAHVAAGGVPMSGALDTKGVYAVYFEETGDRVLAKNA